VDAPPFYGGWLIEPIEELTTLIARARQGDHGAYATLVQRFQDMAVGDCYAKVGDLTVAEDLAQEAFLKAYYRLGALREPAAFPGWLQKILLTQVGRFKQKRQLPTYWHKAPTRRCVQAKCS
jgi:DNA-directed RNA polymerase specialized sigma24 family protein